MSPLSFRGIILALLGQVTLGVNPLDSILSETVEKVLQGIEVRLAQQEEIFRQLLVDQTTAMEAKTDALETRLVESTATVEASFAGQTAELETRLAQQNRGIENALDSLGESIQGQFSAFEETVAKNVTARLDDHLTNPNHTINALLLGMKDTVINEVKKTVATHSCLPSEDHVQHANFTLGALLHDIEELLAKSKNTTNLAESHIAEHLDGINLTLGALIHDMEEKITQEFRYITNTTESLLRETLVHSNHTVSELLLGLEERIVVETQNLATTTERRLKDNLGQINVTLGVLRNDMKDGFTTMCSSEDTHQLIAAVYNSSITQLHILRVLESRGPVTFLRRVDGSVNFQQNWAAYKSGFGDDNEFWLGLEKLHQLTSQHQYGLLVDMEDFSGERKWASYQYFRVGSESGNYVLTVSGYNTDSTAGDSMAHSNGAAFSTFNRDNDQAGHNCASSEKGGWWYKHCAYSNPTSLYKPAGYRGVDCMNWHHAYSEDRSLKSMSLKLIGY